jgi:MoxR-like ATPase
MSDATAAKESAAKFQAVHDRIRDQVARAIVGQTEVVEGVLTALLAGGHVLLEGVPGLGKTYLVRSLGYAVDLAFSRIQFTPDMMPADIRGTNVLIETEGGGHTLEFEQGPLFANLILADEINRATPKTQSALLEAMQERQVSVGRSTYTLEEPYCVMATQNPVEQEGTYPLPEAQLDRFLMKLVVDYPAEAEYHEILNRTTTDSEVTVDSVSNAAEIVELRHTVRAVPVPEHVQRHAVQLVIATQPGSEFAPLKATENVVLGSSPRGAQSLLLCGKVRALLDGRFAVSTDDIRAVAHPVLRHRILLGFQVQASGVKPDDVIDAVLDHVQP